MELRRGLNAYVATQKRGCVRIVESAVQHELHRHHDQSHVRMPGLPFPGLVLRHPDMTLGILKGALDPESLCLHLRELENTGAFADVAQAVLQRSGGIDFPPHYQMPALSPRALLVPQPYSLV